MPTARAITLLTTGICTLGLAFAVPAAAEGAPHSCIDRSAASLDPATSLIQIGQPGRDAEQACSHSGVHAHVTVPDVLCVHVEALGRDELADAHARVPCLHWDGFKDCDQARAAGLHDIPRSDNRYRGYLDEDGNGIACESTERQSASTTASDLVVIAPVPQIIAHNLVVTH